MGVFLPHPPQMIGQQKVAENSSIGGGFKEVSNFHPDPWGDDHS